MKAAYALSTILLFAFCAICPAQESKTTAKQCQTPRETPAELSAKDSMSVISLIEENDLFFSDRYYTNGIRISYTAEGDDFYSSRLQFAFLRLFGMEGRQAYQTVGIGQMMYVDSDIKNPNPPTWDRPYAGWLYIGAGAHLASQDRLDSFTVNLGVVGPISLAEDSQKFIHSIIDSDWPMGWHEQIKNEPGIIISYKHTERFVRTQLTDSLSADFLGSIGADLGNVMTQATVRAYARWGFNMPYSFEPARIDYAGGNDVQWRPDGSQPKWHCFMYAGGAARFVGYDISLDGNTFADSRSVTPKWLVGEIIAGISSRYEFIQADLNWTLRSAEFNNQEFPVHMFWSLAIKAFF